MRCKQGDLAFITKSITGKSEGKIVTVVEYIGLLTQGEFFNANNIRCMAPITDHYWWINSSSPIETFYGPTNRAYSPDVWLTPIEPNPDEQSNTTNQSLPTLQEA